MIQVYDKYGKIKTSGIPGFGTVTNVSSGNLSPLFTTAVTSPTSTPNISFTKISQAQKLFYASPNSGSGVPSFRTIQASDLPSLSGTYVPVTRNITINGVTYDLSADRTWTISSLPSQTGNNGKYLQTDGTNASWQTVDALPIQTGNSGKFLTTDGIIASWATIPLPTPAALTKTDDTNVTLTLGGSPSTALLAATSLTLGWTGTLADSRITSAATWNAKQDAITLTTTGTSGAATFIANTLNIPQYTDQFTGTVTSVGLSMPPAFNVANSPITSSGTLTVTGAGLASQYVRGDGTLANFPVNVGGGASVSYYLNGSVNQGTFGGDTYYQMSKTANTGAAANFSLGADGYIANFITDPGDPALINIPAGNWDFQIYFSASSVGGSPQFYTELYKYDGVNFTLISSGSVSPQNITNGTFADVYISTLSVPATSITVTDRLAIRIYIIHSGKTITMYTQDNKLAEVHTTFSTGLAALNSLTAQVQYFSVGSTGTDFNISSVTNTHTFNLPTASATNRGALSSTDWSAFNAKPTTYYQNTAPTGTGTSAIIVNSIWTHSDTGLQYSYNYDGNTYQWVQQTLPLGPQGPQGANGTNTINSLTSTTFNGILKGNGSIFATTTVLAELGFTPEDVANKENVTLDNSSTKYPTNNLVKTSLDSFSDDVDYAIMTNQRIIFNF